MSFEAEPQFGAAARRAKSRRLRRRLKRGVIAGTIGIGVVLAVAWAGWWWINSSDNAPMAFAQEDDADLVQVEETELDQSLGGPSGSFVGLRGDPMILRLPPEEDIRARTLDAPADFVPARIGTTEQGALRGVRDALFVTERRLVTTLPSSRDDFALFKARRSTVSTARIQAPDTTRDLAPVAAGEITRIDDEGSWGAFIADANGADSGALSRDHAAFFVDTQIEDTTDIALALRDVQRSQFFKDEVVRLEATRSLDDVMAGADIEERERAAVLRAAQNIPNIPDTLPAGSIVAMRLDPDGLAGRLKQMSIYDPERYLASLARVGAGRYAAAADPWFGTNLQTRTNPIPTAPSGEKTVRLLDALYSAGILNGLSSNLVGEIIAAMAQVYDLDRFSIEGDEVEIIWSPQDTLGRERLSSVLYVGIHGPSGAMDCYILPVGDSFGCFDFSPAAVGPPRPGGMGLGMIVPTTGVKTSGFGPRRHPILRQVRNHNGVDWAAPIGTPVVAAQAGVIKVAEPRGSLGNAIYIDHGDGVETRYAHLDGFTQGLRAGDTVGAGDTIGYVGTTGRSTGPHLHFELRVAGQPVDPLTYAGTGAAAHDAVEALVNQIIQVESAGNASAKNPLSTATGLGQFIESTWIRMMRTYRPDLFLNMDRAQLLELRNDPALSREMVRHLARESESYLRERGHGITPGRLYLAHFLGAQGADKALSSDPRASVLDVMGGSVVNANPFLRGKSIADLHAWSDRKMRSRGGANIAPPSPRRPAIPASSLSFRKVVDDLRTQL